MKIQAAVGDTMPELRKVLKLNKYTLGFTFPPKYSKTLGLGVGDFLEISLETPETLLIRKHGWSKRP